MIKSKIRILFLTYRADYSGGPLLLLQLLQDLNSNHDRQDFEFFMSCPRHEELAQELISCCQGFIPIKNLASFFSILNYCKSHDIRIVHSHGRGAGYLSRMLGLFGIRVVHSLHGIHSEGGLGTKIKSAIERLVAFRTDVFVVSSITEEQAGIWQGFIPPGAKAVFIPHRSQFEPSTSMVFKNPIRRLGVLTRLEPEKGNIDLISFFKSCLKGTNWQLYIAGDGSEKATLIAEVQNLHLGSQIHFLGFVKQKASFFGELDVLISFSRGEGMPLTIIEAMANGIPCLLSRVRGHVDFNENSNKVWLFNPKDFSDCYSQLKQIENDKEDRELRIRNARSYTSQLRNFDWDKAYMSLYKEILFQ